MASPSPRSKVHFGYTDGISMTTLRGGPERYPPDHQEPCEPWLFVLRDDAENYMVPEPRELGLNGSFAVLQDRHDGRCRVRELSAIEQGQDPSRTAGGEDMRALAQRRATGVVPRYGFLGGRNALEQLNNFEYVNADGSGDPKGVRCPVGAHMRRINPRGQPVTGQGLPGGSNNTHRLIRRGMPYGPIYDPEQALRWHRARTAGLLHQLKPRESVRVRAEPMGE